MAFRVRRVAVWLPLGFAALPAAAQLPPFTQRVVDATRHGDCKAVADFDGDGSEDVAVGGASGLFWFRSPAWTATEVAQPASGEFTTDMQAGDVDGDGDADLVVPDLGSGVNVWWFENPRPAGDPAADAWPRHGIGAFGWAHDLEVGDVDRDGRLDVVTRQGATALWLQTAPDAWTRVDLPGAVPGGEGVGLGDVDRDGDLDLALNGYWLECPPDPRDGAAWTRHDIVAGWPDLCGARVADVDLDGRPDVILAASESTGRLSWFQGPPDPRAPGPWTETVIDPSVDYVHTFQVVDVDRDGHLDVVFAEMAQSARRRVGVFYNPRGAGAWTLQVVSTSGSHNVRAGDLDGDGDVDLAGANWQGPPVEWWEQGGGGGPVNRAPVVSAGPDRTLVLPARAAALAGSVTDDGLPSGGALSSRWTQRSGPGTAVFADPAAPATTVTVDRPGDYVLRLEADDGALAALDETTLRVRPFASDLVLHWTLDDGAGTAALDSSPWGNDGALAGGAWTAGAVRGGLELDGVAEHVARPSAALAGPFPATPAQADAFTVAAWIRLDALDRRHPIAGKQGDEQRGFLFLVEDDNRLTLEVFEDQSRSDSVRTAAPLPAGRLLHVATTYEFRGPGASAVRLWVDGALAGGIDTAVGPVAVNTTPFEAGRYWWNSGYSVYLDGLLDDVRVYARALGACEVGRLATGSFDADADELPDAWETARLGGLAEGPGDDADGDALANVEEYLAGTDPADAASRVVLRLVKGAAGTVVAEFATVVAAGPGYECESRFYDVTLATDVRVGPWTEAPPCAGLAATGAPAACAFTAGPALDFVRLAPRLLR